MVEGKMAKLLPPALVLKQVVYHDMDRGEKELGPAFRLVSGDLAPGADIAAGYRLIEKEPPKGFEPHVQLHKHDVSSVYMFLGDLQVEVNLEGEKYIVSAPRAAYIPAGVKHTYRPISGTGYVVVILRGAKYE
ncbi:MAG: hypothetical protein HYX92_11385 [Chloroflexi bacterium]|nr:hypothetical protein [Chloroflexota bacterium]